MCVGKCLSVCVVSSLIAVILFQLQQQQRSCREETFGSDKECIILKLLLTQLTFLTHFFNKILSRSVGELGTVEIDVMQPLDPTKRPAVHNPPLNHIGLWVDDIFAAVKHLTANGCTFCARWNT